MADGIVELIYVRNKVLLVRLDRLLCAAVMRHVHGVEAARRDCHYVGVDVIIFKENGNWTFMLVSNVSDRKPDASSALLMMAVVVKLAGIVHFSRCCSTSGLFAVTSFHMLAISSAVSGSPSGRAMHMTRNLSLLTGWICWPFWITTLMLADVMGESVPDEGRTRNLSGAVVLTWKQNRQDEHFNQQLSLFYWPSFAHAMKRSLFKLLSWEGERTMIVANTQISYQN